MLQRSFFNLLFFLATTTAEPNCPCLGTNDLPADVQTDISCCSETKDCCRSEDPGSPPDYGSSCVAWENIGTWYKACHPTFAVNHIINTPDICYTLSIHL